MLKDGIIYIIDFGYAREITPTLCKRLSTETPNMTLMLVSLVHTFRKQNLPLNSYKYLLAKLDDFQRKKFGL